MRYFRRLPLLLRVVSILGLLFFLASTALLVVLLVTSLASYLQSPVDSGRGFVIAMNLVLLSLACSFAVNSYSTRFRRPDRGPFPLDSWQSQVRAIALLSVLPLCAIVLALVIPPTSFAFVVVFPITLLAVAVLVVAQTVSLTRSGPMRTPQTG